MGITVVEIDPDRISALPKPVLVMEGGQPYTTGPVRKKRKPGEPIEPGDRTARPVSAVTAAPVGASESPAPPPPGGGVTVVFELGTHTMRATFNEVSTSKGGTYLVFDLTGRPDVFMPFFQHVDRYLPSGERVVAVPQGGDTAYYLAVDHNPPVAVVIAGRRLYAVPIIQTAQVERETMVELRKADLPGLRPTEQEDDRVRHDQDGYDRRLDASRSDGGAGAGAGAVPDYKPDELPVELPDEPAEDGRDDDTPHGRRSPVLV